MSFQSLFEQRCSIPLEVAVVAFLEMQKVAAPGDPPDETGTLEGQFSVPVPQVLQIMAELVRNEFSAVYAYMTYANSLRALPHHGIAEEFEGHMEDELEHADWLMRRMSVLGGPVQVPDIPPPPASSDPDQIIKVLIRMEQDGIAGWRKLLEVSGENPMRVTVEDYLAKEQEHLDDLWQMLPQEARGDVSGQKMAAEKSDDEAAEAGRRRAVGNAASDFEKDKQHRSERLGDLVGRLLGTGTGTGAGLMATKGGPGWQKVLAATSGAALGGMTGGRVGKHVGRSADSARFEKRFKKACLQMGIAKESAFGTIEMAPDGPRMEDAVPAEMAAAQPSPAAAGKQAPAGLSPDAVSMLQGEGEEARMEAEYFKQLAHSEQQKSMAMEQQAQQSQQQAEQLQQQMDQAMQSAQMAHDTASQAQQGQLEAMDKALQKQTETVQVMQAHTQMKSTLLDTVTNDPVPPVNMAPPPPMQVGPEGQPMAPAEGAPPGAAPPAQGTAPAPAAPAEGSPKQGALSLDAVRQLATDPSARSAVMRAGMKVAPFALAGAALGAGNAARMRGRNAAATEGSVRALEKKVEEKGGFGAAVALAKARAAHAINEAADQYPGSAMAASTLMGAAALGTVGPPAYDLSKYLIHLAKNRG